VRLGIIIAILASELCGFFVVVRGQSHKFMKKKGTKVF